MPRTSRAQRLVLAALAVLALAGRAWGQVPCAAPAPAPCVITGAVSVDTDVEWDVGTRSLTIAAGTTVTVEHDLQFTIRAADITLDPGATIVAPGSDGFGGWVKLEATGTIALSSGSRIDVSADNAGSIDIYGDSVETAGELLAKGKPGGGGFVVVSGETGATIGGVIDTSGASGDLGGTIGLFSSQAVLVSALLDAHGGEFGGGAVEIDAGTMLVTEEGGAIDVGGGGDGGDGGVVLISSGGGVALAAPIDGAGSNGEDDGAGADVDVLAAGDVGLGALMELQGGGADGDGGLVTVDAGGAVDVTEDILATSKTNGRGLGGDVELKAGTSLAIGSKIDVSGGIVGGTLDATAGTSATITGTVLASGTRVLDAFPPEPPPTSPIGGAVTVEACTIGIPQGGTVVNLGAGEPLRGVNLFRGSNSMTIGGTVTAGIENVFEYRDMMPAFTGTHMVTPAPLLSPTPATELPCCGTCSSTTTSTTTTTVSTSTTLAGTSTTTTTVAVPTTSTGVSTTLPSSTTTTSPPAASTTTTTTLPGDCVDQPLGGFDAVDCRLDTIDGMLAGEPVELLGGRKFATQLGKAVARARAAIAAARTGRKVTPSLRRANKQLRVFQKRVARAQKKGMPAALGAELTALAAGATTEIAALRATQR